MGRDGLRTRDAIIITLALLAGFGMGFAVGMGVMLNLIANKIADLFINGDPQLAEYIARYFALTR